MRQEFLLAGIPWPDWFPPAPGMTAAPHTASTDSVATPCAPPPVVYADVDLEVHPAEVFKTALADPAKPARAPTPPHPILPAKCLRKGFLLPRLKDPTGPDGPAGPELPDHAVIPEAASPSASPAHFPSGPGMGGEWDSGIPPQGLDHEYASAPPPAANRKDNLGPSGHHHGLVHHSDVHAHLDDSKDRFAAPVDLPLSQVLSSTAASLLPSLLSLCSPHQGLSPPCSSCTHWWSPRFGIG